MLYGGFNPAMLSGSGDKIDVSRFTHGNVIFPGKYRVDVYINQEWLGRRDIDVKPVPGSNQSLPCMTKSMLIQLGVNLSALPLMPQNTELAKDTAASDSCVNMALQIPNSSVDFDVSELRLNVSIPQLYLTRISRGYVDPAQWEQGINAAFLSYNVNTIYSNIPNQNDQLFANINFGFNVEGWRIRYNGTYTNDPGTTTVSKTNSLANPAGSVPAGAGAGTSLDITNTVQQNSRWQPINAYAQHDVTSLKSQLTIGDAYTNGDLFNSVAIQGVQLASDDRMLPESQRGYAPVIRGIAETNAKVTVRQGGNIVYETTVPPGEFKLDDMYNSGFAGDFMVTILEADGRQKQYVVPYSPGVLLLRPGATRYSLAAGKLLNVTTYDAPVFGQATFQHGMGKGVTFYTGGIGGEYYGSLLVGSALSTSFGSIGLDLTRSGAKISPGDSTLLGRSTRLSYSKLLEQTQTNFSMAAYSYSTSDFLTLSDAALIHDQQKLPGPSAPFLSPKNSFQLSLTQPLSENYGSIFLSGIAQHYWNDAPNAISYQAGYNNNASWGHYGFSVSRTIDALGVYHNLSSVNVSIPIGNEGIVRRPNLTSTVSYGDRQTTSQLAVNGSVDDNGKMNYNAYDNYTSSNNVLTPSANSFGVGGQYSGAYGQAWASYSSGLNKQATLNVSGAVLLHSGGVILAPSLGETIGIVYAPGLEGASVTNTNNNRIDSTGYSVIPFLTPYMNNDISIDPKGSSMNVELDTTSKQIAPRAGAIVLLKFSTTIGRAMLMTVNREDGHTMPIGSSVYDEAGKEIGMLAQGGRFFNRSLGSKGKLTIKWGEAPDQTCTADYVVPQETEQKSDQPYQQMSVSCKLADQVAAQ